MKKGMKGTAIFAAALCALFPISACDRDGGEEAQSQSKVVAGFESYDEMQTFNYYNSFGKIDVNKNPLYVTQGEASAKLTVYGKPRNSAPAMHIYMDTEYSDQRDFSHVFLVTFDMYNASAAATDVRFNFNTFADGNRQSFQSKSVTLAPGEWTNAVIPVDRAVAGLLCDLTAVECLTFTFEGIQEADDEPLVIYADNLQVYFDDKTVEPIQKTFADKEILNFDEDTDLYFATPKTLCRESCKPSLSINRMKKYAREGNSLKISVPKSEHPVDAYSFSGVEFSASLMNQIDLTVLSPENSQGGALTFSICNDSRKVRRLYFHLYDTTGGQTFLWVDMPAGEWLDVVFEYDRLIEAGVKLSSVDRMDMLYDDAAGADSAFNLYVDNIRLQYEPLTDK